MQASSSHPLTKIEAGAIVRAARVRAGLTWAELAALLDAPVVWVPGPGPGHRELLGQLICDLDLRGNLVSDAMLAALCLEHGLTIVSADSDFARFRDVRWLNLVQD